MERFGIRTLVQVAAALLAAPLVADASPEIPREVRELLRETRRATAGMAAARPPKTTGRVVPRVTA